MTESLLALTDFIKDFDLKNRNGIVSFDATVQVYFRQELLVSEANVQVITSAHLATLYLLGEENEFDFLPEILQAKTHLFTYFKNHYLRILAPSGDENFFVSIFPKTM
jgi:hypothetical protein